MDLRQDSHFLRHGFETRLDSSKVSDIIEERERERELVLIKKKKEKSCDAAKEGI